MNLEKLISELETADGLATGGEWDVMRYASCSGVNIPEGGVDGPTIAAGIGVRDRGICVHMNDAQAIAIRHNTAGEVLRHLKSAERAIESLKGLDGRMAALHAKGMAADESRHAEAMAAATALRARADEAESNLARSDELLLRAMDQVRKWRGSAEKAESTVTQLKATIRAHTSEELTAVMDMLARQRIADESPTPTAPAKSDKETT